jgi:activator of HSP90 ATPase
VKSESFNISAQFPISARELYQAWLDSKQHAGFTGAGAQVDPRVGGKFTAWDGYILGKTLELTPYRRIVQAWRTTDFPNGCSDSLVEITLEPVAGGTKLMIKHTGIPEGQGEGYKDGWRQFYFKPMKPYFSGKSEKKSRSKVARKP